MGMACYIREIYLKSLFFLFFLAALLVLSLVGANTNTY
jgi:hypothetical protein